jgi:hypothetical protein
MSITPEKRSLRLSCMARPMAIPAMPRPARNGAISMPHTLSITMTATIMMNTIENLRMSGKMVSLYLERVLRFHMRPHASMMMSVILMRM